MCAENLARIDLVTESRRISANGARNGQADAFAARPPLKDQRTKFRLGPRSEKIETWSLTSF
jgi:hypothetical protein